LIGLVSEWTSDRDVVQEICRKSNIKTKHRLMRGNDLRKAKTYSVQLFDEGCNKVIVLKDLHSSTTPEIEAKFRRNRFEEKVHLCIVVRSIESWLLADEAALSDYLGVPVNPVYNPEEIPNPYDYLNSIFKKARDIEYYKGGKDPAEIARRIRIGIVEKKCSSFRIFKALVQA
jgi:hypothetical protein